MDSKYVNKHFGAKDEITLDLESSPKVKVFLLISIFLNGILSELKAKPLPQNFGS